MSSTKFKATALPRQLELQSTQSEAAPPPSASELEELREVVSRILGYIVTHTQHNGEGDELYNELVPKLLRRS